MCASFFIYLQLFGKQKFFRSSLAKRLFGLLASFRSSIPLWRAGEQYLVVLRGTYRYQFISESHSGSQTHWQRPKRASDAAYYKGRQ